MKIKFQNRSDTYCDEWAFGLDILLIENRDERSTDFIFDLNIYRLRLGFCFSIIKVEDEDDEIE